MAAGKGVQGIEALNASLDAAAHEVASLLDAHRDAGHLLQSGAESDAPRRTGALAADHHSIVVAGHVEVVNAKSYARPVHARRPWLANTLNQLHDQLLDIYSQAIAKAVGQVHGR